MSQAVAGDTGPVGDRLARLRPRPEPGPVAAPLTVGTVPAAVLAVAEAKERHDLANLANLANLATGGDATSG